MDLAISGQVWRQDEHGTEMLESSQDREMIYCEAVLLAGIQWEEGLHPTTWVYQAIHGVMDLPPDPDPDPDPDLLNSRVTAWEGSFFQAAGRLTSERQGTWMVVLFPSKGIMFSQRLCTTVV